MRKNFIREVLFLLGLSIVNYVTSLELPNFIKSCSRNDPNLSECALQAARDSLHQFALGDVSRDLKPLDPLFIKEMVVEIAKDSGFKILFLDNYFHGLSNLHLEKLRFDLNKKQIVVDALVDLEVKSKYQLTGKILTMPIKSDGDSTITLKNALLHIRIWYEHMQADDGKIHWHITKHDIKYEIGKASFKLENLLKEKNIGDQINKLLNELWREIVADVGPHICQSLLEAVVENLEILLKQVPYDQLMPE